MEAQRTDAMKKVVSVYCGRLKAQWSANAFTVDDTVAAVAAMDARADFARLMQQSAATATDGARRGSRRTCGPSGRDRVK